MEEKKIWFTSDTHFYHNKEFLWGGRGFNSSDEMVEKLIQNWNSVVKPNDEVYHLGDVMLNDTEKGIEALKKLNGNIHIIRGNHDTNQKIEKYLECPNVISVSWGEMIKHKKRMIFLSHAPTIYRTMGDNENKQGIINIHGHTHQKTNFLYEDNPYVYHAGMDSHNLTPVLIDDIIKEIDEKIKVLKEGRDNV